MLASILLFFYKPPNHPYIVKEKAYDEIESRISGIDIQQ